MENHTSTPFHRDQEHHPAETEDGARPVTFDQIYDLLRNRRCRYVLEYLDTGAGPVSLSDLSEQLAAREHETEPHQVPASERERVLLGLHQCVLPKMDEFGAIAYDRSRQLVGRGEYADCYVEFLPRRETSRPAP